MLRMRCSTIMRTMLPRLLRTKGAWGCWGGRISHMATSSEQRCETSSSSVIRLKTDGKGPHEQPARIICGDLYLAGSDGTEETRAPVNFVPPEPAGSSMKEITVHN